METSEKQEMKNKGTKIMHKFSMPFMSLLLIVLALFLFVFAVSQAYKCMEESCIEGLNNATASAAEEVNQMFRQNIQRLSALGGLFAEQDHLDGENVRMILSEFSKISDENRFCGLLPGDIIVTKEGPLDTRSLRFGNVAPYGEHFSPLTYSLQYQDQIIRQYFPVEKDGRTVAVAYAVYPTADIARQITRKDYSGELYLMIIDRRTGEITIDTHPEKEYTNIAEFHSFSVEGEAYFDRVVRDLLAGEEGFVVYKTPESDKEYYMTYQPSDFDEFEIVTIIREETAMAGAISFQKTAMLLVLAEFVLLALYGLWVMHRNRRDVAAAVAEENERVALLDALERQHTLEAVDKLAENFEYVSYINREARWMKRFNASGDFLDIVKRFEDDNGSDERLTKFLMDFLLPKEYRGILEHSAEHSLENELQTNGHISADFTLPLRGRIRNYRMKLVLDRDAADGLFLGIYNIDREKRQEIIKKEQENALQENQRIINILSDDYAAVFYVDLLTQRYKTYSMSQDANERFGSQFRSGVLYQQALAVFAEAAVAEANRSEILEAGRIESIRKELENKSTYKKVYQNLQGRYCEIKIVKAQTDDDGNVLSVAVGFADRDDEIRSEQEYQRELKYARDRANAANEAKSMFLFNMSHDIRTPMNAIKGFSERALKHIDDQSIVMDCLQKVGRAGNHLLKLINDILDMARIESGKVVIEESPLDLCGYGNHVRSMLESLAEQYSVELIADKPEIRDSYVYFDQDHMNQVFLNLVSNAIKYTLPGGNVHFSIRQTDCDKPDAASFDFVVADNGIGMTKDFMEHMYEQFSRERNSTTSGIQGTGLGLAITKNLIDLMGGNIEFESEINKGTTVTVHMTFRLCKEDAAAEKDETAIDTSGLKGKRILLVEDNELNREIARDILEEQGILVEEADDGSVAVKMVSAAAPDYYDVVLMDIQMPYMNGYTATAAIRELTNADYSALPIIAMTANAFEEDKRKAFEAGMNAHLSKPIDVRAFLETLSHFSK